MKRLWWLALAAWLPGTLLPARNPSPPPPVRARDHKQADPVAEPPAALVLTDESEAIPPPPEFEKPDTGELVGKPPAAATICEKDLRAYFEARPKTYLIDPQQLLDPQAARDEMDFLKSHADDATIDLFIYVFDRNQEIPGDVRKEELIERFFASGRPALIVYYYLGAPEQSALYLSPSLTDVVSATEQQRTLQSAVRHAIGKTSPQEQLLAFSSHLASRIYWMERLLGDAAGGGDHDLKSAQARAAKLAKKPTSPGEKWARLRPLAEEIAVPGLLLASLLAAAAGLSGWLRWRATYQFPEFAVEPRLGGDHAAGVGAVITFASAALPPAAQCEQVAECWHRN